LSRPLRWKTANAVETAMLDDLQGNILKSHGRDHTAHLLLHFEEPERARAFVRTIGDRVTSAAQQLIEAEVFKQTCKPAGRFLVFFLSCTGYRALEVDENKIPKEKAFGDGMKERVRAIDDRPVDTWDQQF